MHLPNAAVCAGCLAGAVPACRLSDFAGVRSRRRVAGADGLQSRITSFLDVDDTDQAAPAHCSSPRSRAVRLHELPKLSREFEFKLSREFEFTLWGATGEVEGYIYT